MDYQKYSVMFKDCIDAPKFVNLPKNQEFTRHMITADNRYFGNTGMKFNYDSTGGEYVKIRIKLSDYFPDVFNDDGTMTENSAMAHTRILTLHMRISVQTAAANLAMQPRAHILSAEVR